MVGVDGDDGQDAVAELEGEAVGPEGGGAAREHLAGRVARQRVAAAEHAAMVEVAEARLRLPQQGVVAIELPQHGCYDGLEQPLALALGRGHQGHGPAMDGGERRLRVGRLGDAALWRPDALVRLRRLEGRVVRALRRLRR